MEVRGGACKLSRDRLDRSVTICNSRTIGRFHCVATRHRSTHSYHSNYSGAEVRFVYQSWANKIVACCARRSGLQQFLRFGARLCSCKYARVRWHVLRRIDHAVVRDCSSLHNHHTKRIKRTAVRSLPSLSRGTPKRQAVASTYRPDIVQRDRASTHVEQR